MHSASVGTGLVSGLIFVSFAHGMYTKNSPVLQLNAKNYDQLITKSNHTSIVEFYAPWCGHCQHLKPAYEKAAKELDGLAKVAAIDCEDDANKQFCGSKGVQGFPTLKIVRPSKKAGGKPDVEDYLGARSTGSIVKAVASKINNHVTRIGEKDLDAFMKSDKPKAILFTNNNATSALLRSLAIDFLDVISIGQVRDKEKAVVEKFGIEKFPSFLLISEKDKEPIVFDGEPKKQAMVDFLKQAGQPNPDSATVKPKPKPSGDKKKATKSKKPKAASSEKVKPTAESQSEEAATDPGAEQSSEGRASGSQAIAITTVVTKQELADKCLHSKATTCIVAITPADASEAGDRVKAALTQLNTKYVHGHRQLFSFVAVPSNIDGISAITKSMGLAADVELVAVNARRAWWRHYEGDFGLESVEAWIDAIRMGEGSKKKLPSDVIVQDAEEKTEASSKSTEAPAEETKAEDIKHEEL